MSPHYFILTAAVCGLLASCATSDYQASGVSDAWLDTPERVSDAPKLPQSTLTHWKTGLPSAEHVRAITRQRNEVVRPVVSTHRKEKDRDRRRADDDYYRAPRVSGYWVASPHRYRHNHHRRTSRPPYTRTVEKVGPSIVPQPEVPLSTRSYTGGPRLLPRTGVSIVPSVPLRDRCATGER